MFSMRQSNLFKFLVVATICSGFIAGLVYFFPVVKPYHIVEFDNARDTSSVLDIFDKDWYWLVAASREEYDPSFTFKYRTKSRNPAYFGKLFIKVLRDNDKTAGFTAYYKKSFYRGFILFVAVDRAFRGKGYGEALTRFALKELFAMGVGVVELETRTNNKAARSLYEKLGFTVDRIDDGYVYYSIPKSRYHG